MTNPSNILPFLDAEAERLLKLPAVIEQTGLCRSRIYLLISEGRFPAPIKVGSSARWVGSEVEQWVLDTIAVARTPTQAA